LEQLLAPSIGTTTTMAPTNETTVSAETEPAATPTIEIVISPSISEEAVVERDCTSTLAEKPPPPTSILRHRHIVSSPRKNIKLRHTKLFQSSTVYRKLIKSDKKCNFYTNINSKALFETLHRLFQPYAKKRFNNTEL